MIKCNPGNMATALMDFQEQEMGIFCYPTLLCPDSMLESLPISKGRGHIPRSISLINVKI
jgi:hypothetical protein